MIFFFFCLFYILCYRDFCDPYSVVSYYLGLPSFAFSTQDINEEPLSKVQYVVSPRPCFKGTKFLDTRIFSGSSILSITFQGFSSLDVFFS